MQADSQSTMEGTFDDAGEFFFFAVAGGGAAPGITGQMRATPRTAGGTGFDLVCDLCSGADGVGEP